MPWIVDEPSGQVKFVPDELPWPPTGPKLGKTALEVALAQMGPQAQSMMGPAGVKIVTRAELERLLDNAIAEGRMTEEGKASHLAIYDATPLAYPYGNAVATLDPNNTSGLAGTGGGGGNLGGAAGGGAAGGTVEDPESIWDFNALYRRAKGLTGDTLGPWGQYLMRFAEPSARLFGLQQQIPFADPNAQVEGNYSKWAAQPRSVYEQAADLLKRISGFTPQQRRESGLYASQGEDTGGMGTQDLQDLMRYGLRGGLGRYGANWLSGRVPDLFSAWQSRQPATAEGAESSQGTFFDYLRDKFNLW